jgi:hypothetical protein
MELFLKEHNNVIKNNNTAQSELIHILENTPKNINELIINQELHGNIDFSILEDHGFTQLKHIIFSNKGQVTQITGLPSRITKLHCNDQFLLQLINLPSSLKDLDCKNNYIQYIDLLNCTKLIKLQISNNHIETIEHLPSSLEELYCNQNHIKSLNLIHLNKLRVLHTSNNKTIIIIGLPPSVVDFVSENNPYINIDVCRDDPPSSETEIQTKIDYLESLNEYFKLKNKYEEKNIEKKRSLFKEKKDDQQKNGLSKKRLKQKQFVAKCINCKQNGGTIFNCRKRIYTAVCGNTITPCNLNIEINASMFYNNEESLHFTKGSLEELKTLIISTKMKTVFNYTPFSIATSEFKELIDEYEENHQTYIKLIEQHNDIYYGDIRRNCIEEKTKHIFEIISAIKKLLNEYSKTNPNYSSSLSSNDSNDYDYDSNENVNFNILKTAVDIQIKELFPEIHNLRMLKYEIMQMNPLVIDKRSQHIVNNFNEIREETPEPENKTVKESSNNGSILTQFTTALNKHEYYYHLPKVVHFIKN